MFGDNNWVIPFLFGNNLYLYIIIRYVHITSDGKTSSEY